MKHKVFGENRTNHFRWTKFN